MPSKIQLDVNLWFLYLCLQKSDYKTIDFNAVGSVANLNPPAARMRFTRLKKQIESGSLTGTQGTQETPNTAKKTKTANPGKKGARKEPKKEPDTNQQDMFKQEPVVGSNDLIEIPEVEELDFDIKMETDEKDVLMGDSYGLARMYGEGPGAEDNDEDVPLAKKRRMASAILGMENAPAKPSVETEGKRQVVPPNPIPIQNRGVGHGESDLTPWGLVGPAGMNKKGGRPATYDANKLAPHMDPSPQGLGPFPSIMPEDPRFPHDPAVKSSHLCNPDIPAIKVTDLDSDKPTTDCSKEAEKTIGTVEERINNDLFGPNNAHLWVPKKRDPVVTLPPNRTRVDVPVLALIEEHERRFGSGRN